MKKTKELPKEPNRSADKILNNSYNRGDVEFDPFKKIQIESNYLNDNLDDNYSAEEYRREKYLNERIYNIINENEIYKVFLSQKKATRDNIGNLYKYILDELGPDLEEYTKCEITHSCINALDVSYESFYNSLFIIHKSQLMEEMNSKYNVYKKKNFSPLF